MSTLPPNQEELLMSSSDGNIAPSPQQIFQSSRRFNRNLPRGSSSLAQRHRVAIDMESKHEEQQYAIPHSIRLSPRGLGGGNLMHGRRQRDGKISTTVSSPSPCRQDSQETLSGISLNSYDETNVASKVIGTLQGAYGYRQSDENKGQPNSNKKVCSSGASNSIPSQEFFSSFSLQQKIENVLQKDYSSKASSGLNSLPSEILLRCLSFCPLKTLVAISTVNRRLHALSSTNSLWIPFAQAYGVELHSQDDYQHVKQRFRERIIAHQRAKEQEVKQCEDEYALLVQRIKEKSDAIRATPINIDETLYDNQLTPKIRKNFSSMRQHTPTPIHRDSVGGIPVSADFIHHLQNALIEVDSLRKQIVDRLDKNNIVMGRHHQALLEIENHLEVYGHGRSSGCSSSSSIQTNTTALGDMSTSGGAAVGRQERRPGDGDVLFHLPKNSSIHGESPQSPYLWNSCETEKQKEEEEVYGIHPLSPEELLAFERRLVKLIINGKNFAPTTANPGDFSSPHGIVERDLCHRKSQSTSEGFQQRSHSNVLSSSTVCPILTPVLRRGIQDFGSLELLLSCTSSDSELTSMMLKPIQGRYDAFKRFFPLNEDYYTVKSIVGTQNSVARQSTTSGCANSNESSGGLSRSLPHVLSRVGNSSVPHKYRILYKRITQLLRRIQSMKDSEVLSTVL